MKSAGRVYQKPAQGIQYTYRITVEEQLDERWSSGFDGMVIRREGAVTTLVGPVIDQPALYGILLKIQYLNLTLVSVNRLDDASQPRS